MKRNKSTTSQNRIVSEEIAYLHLEGGTDKVIKLSNFVDQNADAKSYTQSLIRHISRQVNRHKMNYGQLRYVFRMVREQCSIEVSSSKGRRLVELPTAEEMQRFYNVIKNPVHRLLFETLENTGLRIAELANLEVRRINFEGNLVFVSQGKGKKDRVTVIGNRLKEKLLIYLDGRSNRYLFESNRNTKFSTRRIEQICENYKREANIEQELTPHTFRHIWNSSLAAAGLSEERRAILAGHEDLETQKIYTHLTAGGFKDDVIAILDKNEN